MDGFYFGSIDMKIKSIDFHEMYVGLTNFNNYRSEIHIRF